MSSVLLINETSEGIPLLLRMAQEGSIGKVYSTQQSEIIKGYQNPTKVMTLSMIEQFDLIIASGDTLEIAKLSESAITRGLPLCGYSALSYNLLVNEDIKSKVAADVLRCTPHMDQQASRLLVGGWYNQKEGIVLPFYGYNFNRMLEGNRGAEVESQGAVVWLADPRDELIHKLLLPLEPILNKVKYFGPVQIYCALSEKEIYLCDIRVKFDYDTIQAFCELLKTSLFDFLWQLKEGRSAGLQLLDQYGISVRVSIPPHPYPANWDANPFLNKRLVSLPDGARKHFYLSDVKLDEEGKEIIAGVDGNIGCATARGIDIHEARSRVYRTLNNTISLPDIQFRGDIGLGVEMKIDQGKTWGWMNA